MRNIKLTYSDNIQIKKAIKEIALHDDIKMSEIAKRLNISNSQLTNTLNKKGINFNDIKKILDIVGYDLVIEFKPKDALERVANKASKTTLDTLDTNTLDALLEQIKDDEPANTEIKVGHCGNKMVDDWMDRNGYTINHKLYKDGKMDSKLLDKIGKELFIAINFGRTKEYVDKKLLVKVDNSK